MAAKSPFDEEFTPEEEAALKSDALPPAEEEATVDDAIAEAAAGKAPAAAPEKSATEEPPAPAPAAEEEPLVDEKDLAAFLEKHKGKTPEELTRLAFQQQKRASKSEAQNRQVNQRLAGIAENAKRLAERRQQLASTAEERKTQFREKLTSDPDAATAELFDQKVDSEVAEAETAARLARVDQAIVYADTYIPEFEKQWAGMKSLANEFGYTDAELDGIDDGRALVMLSLANHTARLMKAGIMDRFGNIDISKIPAAEAAPTDPRLKAPEPQRTLGGRASGGAANVQSIEEQLAAIYGMTDAEMSKFEAANPGAIDDLLRKAAA